MKLDHTSSVPLHLQAEELLRQLISSKEYQHGKLLPKEVELSEQLHISRNTLRKAIDKLVFEGLLVRKRGIGTKVQQKTILSGARNWLSFSQEMKKLGVEIKDFELHVSYKRTTEEINTFFQVDTNQDNPSCMVLERVRGNKEFPFVYFISYFNPEIPFDNENNFSQPLYSMLEEKYHIVVKKSREEISASLAGADIAEKLNIDAKDPILVRKRFVYDVNNVPIEFNIGYYRADSFTYTLESEKQ